MSTHFISHWQQKLSFLDVHYHADPDAYTRKYNAVQAGVEYNKIGGGVVLKSHLGCTCAAASIAQSMDLPVFGSVALNAIAGGINLRAIQQSLCYINERPESGRLIIDLPTVVNTQHKSKMSRTYSNSATQRFAIASTGISDEQGKILPVVEDLLDFCQSEPVVLSTGHAIRNEIEQLVNLVYKKGGIRLLLNQPANPISGMNANALKNLGTYDWLYIEQTALTFLLDYQSKEDFYEVLSDVNNLIYSSDLGQVNQLLPKEWLSQSYKWFSGAGLSSNRIQDIVLLNPLKMLA